MGPHLAWALGRRTCCPPLRASTGERWRRGSGGVKCGVGGVGVRGMRIFRTKKISLFISCGRETFPLYFLIVSGTLSLEILFYSLIFLHPSTSALDSMAGGRQFYIRNPLLFFTFFAFLPSYLYILSLLYTR